MPPEDNLNTPAVPVNPQTENQNQPQPQTIAQQNIQQPPTTQQQPEQTPQTIQNPALQDSLPPLPAAIQTPLVLPQTPNIPNSEPKKNHTFLKVLIALLIVIPFTVIGVSFAWAYENYPLVEPPQTVKNTLDAAIALSPLPKPKRIIVETALSKNAKLKTAEAKAELSIIASSPNTPVSSAKITVSGPVEFDKLAQGSTQNFQADVAFEAKSQEDNFNLSASIITVDNTFYFKVNQIPQDQAYADLSPYIGKWYFYKIPKEYSKAEQDSQTRQKVVAVITEFIKKTPQWTTITSQDNGFYNMEITPPKTELVDFIYDLGKAYVPENTASSSNADEKAQIQKSLDKISGLKITTKIDKQNYFLNELKITFGLDLSSDYSAPGIPQFPEKYDFSFTLNLSNFNQPVTITAPDGAQDFKQAMENQNNGFYPSGTIKQEGTDAQIKNDIGVLATELQAYYTTPGNGSYPKDLSKLVETGGLKILPTPPAETGLSQYVYVTYPPACDETPQNYCSDAALFAPLTAPKTAGDVWCWQSTTARAQEMPPADCVAGLSSTPQPSSPVTPLPTPKPTPAPTPLPQSTSSATPVLGAKYSWGQNLIGLFKNFLR